MNANPEKIEEKNYNWSKLGFMTRWPEHSYVKGLKEMEEARALVRSCHSHREGILGSWHDGNIFNSPNDLLKSGIGGLVVDDLNKAHVGWIVSALEHGIPVLCREPPMLKIDDVRRIVNAARVCNCLFAINFPYRHIKGMSELREHIRRGDLGNIHIIDLTFRCGDDWIQSDALSGEAQLKNLSFHLLDLVLWLLGFPNVVSKKFYSLKRTKRVQPMKQRQDYTLVRLNLANGAVVRLASSQRASSCDAVIDMGIYGDCGDDVYESCNESLFSFVVGRSIGGKGAGFNCEWRDRALNDWLECLYSSSAYDPVIDNFVYLTELFDRESSQ